MTKEQLVTLTPEHLRGILEKQYYHTCIERRTLITAEEADAKLLQLIEEIRAVEKVCAFLELYPLAIVCRDTNKELLGYADLTIS